MHKQGDKIEVKTNSEEYKGVFVKEDDQVIFIKLKNGYNIGISKKRVKSLDIIEQASAKKDKRHETLEIKEKKSLPTIALLHTGGTIASKVDYETGAVSAKFTPEEIISLFPELSEIANIKSKLISNIMSENIRFHHYNIISKAVEEEIKEGADGVIITHGTDTLHYTSAALSFSLENINIPVVIIGSQRSSDRPSSDSSMNLLSSAVFIANSKQKGVFICMHEGISDDTCIVLDGTNARKMHTSRRDAFRPINKTPVARVEYIKKTVEILSHAPKQASKEKFSLKQFDEKIKVGLAKVHPQMFAEELSCYEGFDGLVIEGTGLGHSQTIKGDEHSSENEKIKKEIEKLAKKMPVVMTSQAIYGRVNMNVYSPGRELIDMGIIGNYCDMTPETAFIKLAWLISNYQKDEIKELFEKNLVGEMSERSEKDTFLI